MWDEEAGEWVDLECTVDPATNTITAKVSHFSAFSVIAYTRPAAFEATYLLVFPTQVDTGETVKARVRVTNTDDLAGSYKVTFEVGKEVVATRQVTLDGGASQQVEFSTSKDAAGTYTVSVNGLSGDFTVKAPPAPAPAPAPAAPAPAAPAPAAPVPPAAPAVTWAIIGGIVVGVVVLIQYAIAIGKRRYTWVGGLVTLGILLAISGWHSSLEQVITVMLVGNLALFLYCFLRLFGGVLFSRKD